MGVCSATHFLEGVTLHDDGALVVDVRLRAAEGLHAAGDIVSFPYLRTGERAASTLAHGAAAGARAGARHGRPDTAFDGVPFFWTRQFDAGLLYVGHASQWDEIIYTGDLAAHDFLAFYVKGGRVAAAGHEPRPRHGRRRRRQMRTRRMPSPERIRPGRVEPFGSLLRDAGSSIAEGVGVGLSAK